MDYAERGTVEKTLDQLIEDSAGIADGLESDQRDLTADGELTDEGRAFFTGVLSGILGTVRTFSEGDSTFDAEDIEEIQRITRSRETELLSVVTDQRD